MNLMNIVVPPAKCISVIVILWPTLYFIYKYKYLKQKSSTELERPCSCLDRFEGSARLQVRLLCIIYTILLLKYLALAALDLELLAAYRWLDCFLVGRPAFVGRTGSASKYTGIFVICAFSAYRLILIIGEPNFNFQYIEFLLNGFDAALESEFKANDAKFSRAPQSLLTSMPPRTARQALSRKLPAKRKHLRRPYRDPIDSCYFVSDYFGSGNALFLRFSRSVDSWRLLVIFSSFYGFLILLYLTIIVFAAYFMIGPIVLTNMGFKLNYGRCYEWLLEEKLVHGRDHPAIYSFEDTPSANMLRLNKSQLPFVLPLDDLATATFYNALRISLDIFENHFLYSDFFVTLGLHSHSIFLMMFDVYINFKTIQRRLIEINHFQGVIAACDMPLAAAEKLLSADSIVAPCQTRENEEINDCAIEHWLHLCHEQCDKGASLMLKKRLDKTLSSAEQAINFIFGLPSRLYLEPPISQATYKHEIVRIQNILVDHFLIIQKYNKYTEFHMRICIAMWLIYTSALCIWVGMMGIDRLALEFFAIFLLSFVLIIFQLIGPSFLHASNCRLYPLIASTMAMDRNSGGAKLRWINILNFYFPAPLYCFSFFKSSNCLGCSV